MRKVPCRAQATQTLPKELVTVGHDPVWNHVREHAPRQWRVRTVRVTGHEIEQRRLPRAARLFRQHECETIVPLQYAIRLPRNDKRRGRVRVDAAVKRESTLT